MIRGLIRLMLVVVVLVAAAFFLFGYWTNGVRNTPDVTDITTPEIDTAAARQRGAEIGEKAARAGCNRSSSFSAFSPGSVIALFPSMKVRITREPMGVVDGMALRHYHAGAAYEIPAVLAEYLVAEGYAAIEMRQHPRSPRPRKHERRRSQSRA